MAAQDEKHLKVGHTIIKVKTKRGPTRKDEDDSLKRPEAASAEHVQGLSSQKMR